MDNLTKVKTELQPIKQRLKAHPLYTKMNSIEDIRIFSEVHIFSVWDFISLLKSLQYHLSTLTIPWVPFHNPEITRFINEIVIDRESDLNMDNEPQSHFEMYLDAMTENGADQSQMANLITSEYCGFYPIYI